MALFISFCIFYFFRFVAELFAFLSEKLNVKQKNNNRTVINYRYPNVAKIEFNFARIYI